MDTDTGWSRNAGESTGRWRTILARASGRASVPTSGDSDQPVSPGDPPAAGYPSTPAGAGYPATPAGPAYPTPADPAAGASYGPAAQGANGAGSGFVTAAGYPTTTGYASSPGYLAPPPDYASGGSGGNGTYYGEAAAVPAPRVEAVMPRVEWVASAQQQSPAEQALAILRRDIGVPRVIAFGNPKGGVHKTTATVLAAAAIGHARGRGVVAWDDNELRGTLGLRAGSARHAKTIRHLVTELSEVELHTGKALMERMDDFLRHASDGSYDVLAGEEDPRFSWRLDPPTVGRVLDLLTRTHEIICVDTGNNVESGNWRTIMQAADQLVITTVPREDSAFSADWMMDVLVEAGREDLVANAVTIVSMTTPRPTQMQEDLVRHFRGRNRAVCVVPYDPYLEQGGFIDHTVLQPATLEAWLEAAAVIMEPFGR